MKQDFAERLDMNRRQQADLPTLDRSQADEQQAHSNRMRYVLYGVGWLTPVLYILMRGEKLRAKLEANPSLAPHVPLISAIVLACCAISVVAVIVMIRRAFAGKSFFALIQSLIAGLVEGESPTEILDRMNVCARTRR